MSTPQQTSPVFPGADERTPSRSQYFSWINNTNEGATEAQTLTNLAFFEWLKAEYGMRLDIYAFDAGAIDGASCYGSMDSERFARQFPRGFDPLFEKAESFDCRLGIWAGPDGFGTTPEDEATRIDMMTRLCSEYHFALFKIDAVCGQLREEKQDAFIRQMTACREHSPDLILLNHRLKLGKALHHATTFLWGGEETYIDVHMVNRQTAPHNRAVALQRGLPPDLKRLTEDHGVCLSSCLDFWEDDLVLQAFNRNLILAPEIYGNPWLLRDNEFPRLARLFNLHRRWRDIMVDGITLDETRFGPHAVSRGDPHTRIVTLRNLDWNPVQYSIPLDETIGLAEGKEIEVRRLHPHERILGTHARGDTIEIEVLPFRACLLQLSAPEDAGVGIRGCDFDVVQDVPGRPLKIALLGMPGQTTDISLQADSDTFTSVRLDGENQPALASGESIGITFPGTLLKEEWHRKLGALQPIDVPDDAEALYEATCFAADNNALEVRELARSGPSSIPEVRAARDAFFGQSLFAKRHLRDTDMFDDDPQTAFAVSRRWMVDRRIRGGSFRLDCGRPVSMDRLLLEVGNDYFLQPLKSSEGVRGSVSADLKTWTPIQLTITDNVEGPIPPDTPVRYVRLNGCPDRIAHVRGYYRGAALDRRKWRASNLFGRYGSAPAVAAYSHSFTLPEIPDGSYLAIAIAGDHGEELAYAAVRAGETYIGAPRRSPSYPSNSWECPVRSTDGNYTYYVPLRPEMAGIDLEAVVLLLKGASLEVRPEVWITSYPIPFRRRMLTLERGSQ